MPNETAQLVAFCATGLLLLLALLGIPAGCQMAEQREITERVRAACAGDLNGDAARSAACTLALTQRANR